MSTAKPAERGETVYYVTGDTAYEARVRAVDAENRVTLRYETMQEGRDRPKGEHARAVPEKAKAAKGDAYWTRQKPKEAEVVAPVIEEPVPAAEV